MTGLPACGPGPGTTAAAVSLQGALLLAPAPRHINPKHDMKRLCMIFFAISAILFAVNTAAAQNVETERAGIARPNLVSGNPIAILFEWYNLEFERALNPAASFAIAVSSFEVENDERYSILDVIGRYYPNAKAVRGFSVGASLGWVNLTDGSCDDFRDVECDGSSATIGIRGDYVWILGRDQHFAVAAGLGARRVIDDDGALEQFLPIGRLSIGYAW